MAQPITDTTFSAYTPIAAHHYATHRPSYPTRLINLIIAHHTSTGGQLGTLIDVGCGPGTVTRQLSPFFVRAVGLDPGEGMIAAARELGGVTRTERKVRFEVGSAEGMDERLLELGVEEGVVDMVTAATAAHWFDLKKWYVGVGRMLRPGGSVAILTTGSWRVDERRMGEGLGGVLQRLLERFGDEVLGEYKLKGNRAVEENEDERYLPWNVDAEVGRTFEREQGVLMREWNGHGEHADLGHGEMGVMLPMDYDVEGCRGAFETSSPVARWREAHKLGLESGETRDCVDVMVEEMKTVLEEYEYTEHGGVIAGITPVRLVMFKKKKKM